MGRLIGLELYNFKSYRGKVSVGFGTSYFTSIIGPNGSGKSNMMDAISFVLGVRSNQLRSKNIKALIYRGRIEDGEQGEENGGGNTEGESDVELGMSDNEDDGEGDDLSGNSNTASDAETAYVTAVYEKESGEILNLKRKINSNGSSSFIVNDVQVSVSQYLQILKEENILIKAKNFLVFQGDVEKVASQSPLDLTKMVETVSGSANLKKQYDALKEEKEKAHDITALKNSQKRNLKDEIKNLKIKCYESDLFNKKTKKLEQFKITKYLSKLDYNDRLREKLLLDLENKTDEARRVTETIEAKHEEYKEFVRTQSDEHMTIKEYESKIEIDESTLKVLKTNIIPLESETSQLSKKVKDYDIRIEQNQLERDDQLTTVAECKEVLDSLQTSFRLFNSERENDDENQGKKTASYSSNLKMLTEYNQLRDNFLLLSGDLEMKITDLTEERLGLITEIDSLKLSENIINSRIQELDSKKSVIEKKSNKVENQILHCNSSIKNFNKELNSLESLRASIKEKEKSLNHELKAVLLRLNEINAVQRESKKEKRLRETCATLKKLFPNVRGLLNDLCKPKQKKYSIALAAILGKNFDAIIVDTIATATECIDYMKEQRLGVASFIPLDTVKVQPLDSNLRNLTDKAIPIIDVISYPSEFERAIQYVCGDAMVCDTIDVATSLRWGKNIKVKLVTLDGALIHKSGLMTGGGNDNFNTKWDKSEIGLLTERKEELKLKINEIHSNIPDELKDRVIADEINKLETNVLELNKKLEDISRNLRDVNVELDHEHNLQTEIRDKAEKLNSEIVEIDDQVSNESIELKRNQEKIYHDFCNTYGFDTIEDYEVNHSAKLIKESRENTKYMKEIQRAENRLNFETERLEDYNSHIEKLKSDRENYYKSWIKLTEERDSMVEKIDDVQSSLDVTKEDYNKLKKKAKSLLSKATNMESELNVLKSDLKYIKGEILNIEENLDSLKLEKKTQLINARVENIKIPFTSGSLNDIPLEDGAKDRKILDHEWDALLSNLEINYAKLDDDYRVFLEGEDMDESYEENTPEMIEEKCKLQIEKLQEEVRNIHPDIYARDHLETAEERFKEIDKEFLEARKEEKRIINEFEQVKEQRLEKFKDAFEHISSSIGDVYKDLTKSKASPLGGSAFLTLEDEDEPFSFGIKYHIMPPLKRFRDIENLSGGEKTIGALALLFAVHSYHPSPFFVLDEVDAALDNSNVNQIANYIAKNKGPNFQFIVISLKNNLFERSDALVGIYRDQNLNSSKILTLDLREYEPELA